MPHCKPDPAGCRITRPVTVCIFAGSLLLAASDMAAQDVPAIVDPGRIEQHIEPPETVRPLPETPELRAPGLVAPEEAERIRFTLHEIRFDGVTTYTDEELAEHYRRLVGQEISLADIYDVLDDVISRYRDDGYALVSALIPDQDFSTGSIRLRILEGYVSDVIVDGTLDVDRDVKLLQRHAENIIEDRPLRRESLERAILLANDIPGLSVAADVQPARAVPGAIDLMIETDQQRYEIFGNIDNYGPKELGPKQFQIGASLHSLFRLGDTTRFAFGGTPDIDTLRYYLLRHAQIINTSGLTLEFNAAYIETKPDIDIAGIEDLEGEAMLFGLRATYPLIRSRTRNLFLHGSFEYLDSDNAFLDQATADSRLISDSIRSLRAGAYFSQRDGWHGDSALNLTVSQGLNVIGARAGSRENGRVSYTKIDMSVQRLQRLGERVSALVTASGQYAFTPLLSPEDFGYGGRRFGRAFRPSELTGDHGLAGGLELRYRHPGFALISHVEPYAFADAGKVWHRAQRGTFPRRQSAASAGGGLRIQVGNYFTIEAEATRAAHRSRASLGEDGWVFFARLTGTR